MATQFLFGGRILKALLALALVALLSACATPQHNYRPDVTAVSHPPLNTIVEVGVGDEMVKQGRYTRVDTIFVQARLSVSAYTLTPGYFRKIGEDKDGEFFMPTGASNSGQIQRNFIADPPQAVYLQKEGKICVVTIYSVSTCGGADGFEKRKRDEVNDESFQRTLVYNGRVGAKINIGYREFSNSMARPAFNNNVEYDLTESKEIAYRGAQLEVLDATNRTIKYRVIKNFNEATQ